MANEIDEMIEQFKVMAESLRVDLTTPLMVDLLSALSGVSEAWHKRQQASQDAIAAALSYLALQACQCERQFLYSGPIVKPCRLCLTIVACEKAVDSKGESKKEHYLKTSIKV